MEELNKMYSGLYLDKHHLVKSIENAEGTKREMMKRNESAIMKLKRSSKSRMRIRTEADMSVGRQVFKEVKNDVETCHKKMMMGFSCWSRKKKRIKGSRKMKVQDENNILFC